MRSFDLARTARHLLLPLASALALAILLSTLAVSGASAAPVTVQASFTAYYGCIGEPASGIVQWFNGTQVNGNPATDAPCPGGSSSVGLTTLTLPGGNSVDFYNNDAGGAAGYDNTHNVFSFTPAPVQDVGALGQQFLWGDLSIANGVWVSDFTLAVTFTTYSIDPALNDHTWTDLLVYHLTPNPATGTPHDNRDFVSVVGHPELGTIGIDELTPGVAGSNVLTVGLLGHIGSLHLDAFVSPAGYGSLDVPGGSVPEPPTLALLGLALTAGAFTRRRAPRV
ncbi:MAG: PEP-CTERM sorting domain-containing protein [Burkholderiaceae bacterium]